MWQLPLGTLALEVTCVPGHLWLGSRPICLFRFPQAGGCLSRLLAEAGWGWKEDPHSGWNPRPQPALYNNIGCNMDHLAGDALLSYLFLLTTCIVSSLCSV